MTFKALVVGCGAQGRVISTCLSQSTKVEEILVADLNVEECKRYANRIKSSKLSVYRLDASNLHDVVSLAKNADVLVNAVTPKFNLTLMDAALKSDVHYVDLAFGPPYDTFEKQMNRNDDFKSIHRTALTCTGSSPGIINVLAAHAADDLDTVKSIRLRIGDVLDSKESISTWSPETMLGDMAEEPIVFENGEYKRVPPFSGRETYDFPLPVGPQPSFMHVHEEALTLPRFIGKGINYLDIKLGTPNMPLIKSLVELGLCRTDPIDVNGVKVVPRDVLLRLFPPPPTPEELEKKLEDGTITDAHQSYVVEVVGTQKDHTITYRYVMTPPSLREVQKIMPGATHESFLTGTSAAIFIEILSEGRIGVSGVIAPECLNRHTREIVLSRLAQLGVDLQLRTETHPN